MEHRIRRICFKRIFIVAVLSAAIILATATPVLSSEQPSSWAEAEVNRAIATGLVPEILQSRYAEPITRAEFCALAVTLYETAANQVITERQTFADTTDENVEKMSAVGVVAGTDTAARLFSPDQSLTREQAAAILARLSAAVGKSLAPQASTSADRDTFSDWAVVSIGQVQAAGIMSDMGHNLFSPRSPYTREQSIATILRLYGVLNNIAAPAVVLPNSQAPSTRLSTHQIDYNPVVRAADAIRRARSTSTTEILGMPIATLIQYSDAMMQIIPRNNSEYLPKQTGFDANGASNDVLTERMLAAFKDLAAKFTEETGYSLGKYSTVEVVTKLYDWSLKNPQYFIGADTWWVTGNGYPAFANNNMPLYNLPYTWNPGNKGNCGVVTEWQVGILRNLGVYAYLLGGYLILDGIDDAHAAVVFYDPDGKRWLTYDFQNKGVQLGIQEFYDNTYDHYAATNFVSVAITGATSDPIPDMTEAERQAYNCFLGEYYQTDENVIIDGWEFGGGSKQTLDLPFNTNDRNPVLNNWLGHTQYLVTPWRRQFEPNKVLSRKEFTAMLVQYLRAPIYSVFDNYFTDVPNNDPLAFHLSLAGEMGLISGRALRPDDLITRAECAEILNAAAAWCQSHSVSAKNPLDDSNPTGYITKIEACGFITELLSQI